jgi:hypothetical protein
MEKIFLCCFEKWWKPVVFAMLALVLLFMFKVNEWLFVLLSFLGFISLFVSMIFQFIKKRWSLSCLTILAMGLFIIVVCMFVLTIYASSAIHYMYSKQYENKKEIENIIGVKIPKFKVIDYRLVHSRQFDFEFEVQTTIKFKVMPEDKLFQTLDSICNLPIPQEPDKNSSYFYYSLEGINQCWSKNGDEYQYSRYTDFGKKILHSEDAYFSFTITKGREQAKITYGNY